MAVGLSTDNKMGSDSVVECVRDGNGGTVNMYTSYTRSDHTGSDRHPVRIVLFHTVSPTRRRHGI